MRRFSLILLFAAASILGAAAQTLDFNALAVKTLDGRFTQVQESPLLEKPDVSTGRMQYVRGDKLVWKYETPKLYQLSMLKDRLVVTSSAGAKVTSYADNPMMEQMRDLMMGLISGDSLRPDAGKFDISVREDGKLTIVTMVPRIRQMKKSFSTIELTFRGLQYTISKVVLSAPDGGKTTITFSDVKTER